MWNLTRLPNGKTVSVKKYKNASNKNVNNQYIKLYENKPRIEARILKAKIVRVNKC